MPSAVDIKRALQKQADPNKALVSARFFKTAKGQYGEGDVFIGVTVPEQRQIAKRFIGVGLSDIKKLLDSKIHEHRLTGLFILVYQFQKAKEVDRKNIYNFYLKNKNQVNNWDLVDSSASYIVGEFLMDQDRLKLYTLARSKNMWDRRIAIVATHAFIKKGDLVDTFKISEILLQDKEDLLHKAAGWMLREAGKKDQKKLEVFLKKHTRAMPRTMLRYAIERLPEKKRKMYLNLYS